MCGEFGLDGTQEPGFGGDLGGQIRERDRGMTGVELDRRLSRVDPLPGTFGALMTLRGSLEHRRQPLEAQPEQGVRVGVAFQDREVGSTEITGQRRHRHQLASQVLDPPLGRCQLDCVSGAGLVVQM
jgi:hypothetical protein